MKSVLEGLLFITGDEGLTIEEISEVLEIEQDDALELINKLKQDYSNEERGIMIQDFAGKYKLTTKKEHKAYYEKLSELSSNKTLSQSALETLAIIAYNQPITRLEIDELRGIQSSQMIRNLISRDLVKEVGRKDTAGKPRLYAVTDEFLDYFGLTSLNELPTIEVEESDDVELYNSKYKEEEEIEQL